MLNKIICDINIKLNANLLVLFECHLSSGLNTLCWLLSTLSFIQGRSHDEPILILLGSVLLQVTKTTTQSR